MLCMLCTLGALCMLGALGGEGQERGAQLRCGRSLGCSLGYCSEE